MKILAATDGSNCSERAVNFASKLASESKSKITIVYAVPKLPPTREELVKLLKKQLGSEKEAGNKYLQKGKKIAEKFGAKTETKLLEGNPVEEILKEAKNGRHDLIVVGSYGKGVINKFLLGSVSSKLLHLSRIPVLVVR
ncbi:MAG: universal stress protein [Candidatus Hydrothermarchaeota archaeon]|nr:universal stress protein [Candidatus Hydrothermarchaeota archaeon]